METSISSVGPCEKRELSYREERNEVLKRKFGDRSIRAKGLTPSPFTNLINVQRGTNFLRAFENHANESRALCSREMQKMSECNSRRMNLVLTLVRLIDAGDSG